MMHLDAIIKRNKRPTPQPTQAEARYNVLWSTQWREALVACSPRPWDKSDPLPEAEAHPR